MKRSTLSIYALAVCGLLIIPLLISSGIFIYSIISVVSPDLTMPAYVYERYQSDTAYREYLASRWPPGEEVGTQYQESLSDVEIARQRQIRLEDALVLEQRQGMQDMIRSVIFGLFSLGLFLLHWRIARRADEG